MSGAAQSGPLAAAPADEETAGPEPGPDTGEAERDGLAEITRRLDELTDLFVRRLAAARARRPAVHAWSARPRRAELGPFRQYLHPLVHGLALVVDRLDRYEGSDPEFAASVRAELLDLLARQGVREIEAGDGFDPTLHEAVEVRHDPDAPDGAVLEVRRTGFAHGDWVFRPAQVVVNADTAAGAE